MAEQQQPTDRMKIGVIGPLEEGGNNGKTPTYGDVREMAVAAEAAGLDSFWLADHFIFRMPGMEESGQWEALTYLSALAVETSHIALGPLVAATSFRSPALLAKMADALDEISGGRFVLGLGSGWHEPEYKAFGFPFDHLASRFEEALQIIAPLLREGHVDVTGTYYSAENSGLRPRGPSPKGPRILIGAKGPRMLTLVARYADAWNTAWHMDPTVAAERWENLKTACAQVGRDPSTIEFTVGVPIRVLLNGETAPEGEKTISGPPDQVAEALHGFAAIGAQHLILAPEPNGPGSIERIARVLELYKA
ncbi:MAG TPA: LLM class flavin-dependent oxidoreductase [Ktedonobacterales bacterium]|nr:LLM class flavin-dependent oxidoreductase [Ktedonobacterales bacterium]